MTAPVVAHDTAPPEPMPHARVPAWGAVLGEQLRRVGLAIRLEVLVGAGGLLLLATLPMLLAHLRVPGHRSDMQFDELMMAVTALGALAPFAVWKGEEPSRRAYLWTLPVDRSRHTLARVLAGWLWTMLIVGAFVLWVLLLARATGGELSNGDSFVPLRPLPEDAAWRLQDHFHHPWPVPAWQWIVPFTAATAAYVLGSVVAIATDHPWRWYGGILLACTTVLVTEAPWAHEAAGAVFGSRYGLETLVRGSELVEVAVATPAGHVVRHPVLDPQPGRWAMASALWIGAGLLGVLVAAHRHQER